MLFLLILTLLRLSTANIAFHRVQPTCNASNIAYTGCLRGQLCTKRGTCVTEVDYPFSPLDIIRRVTTILERQVPRSDGRCGKDFGDVRCDPTGAYGGCCSEYGYVHSWLRAQEC
jgi:hypothetical protein